MTAERTRADRASTGYRLVRSAFWEHPAIVGTPFGDPSRSAISELHRDVLLSLLTEIRVDLCVEIGAFEGRFSRTVAERFPRVRCVAFEANPYVFMRFFADFAANERIEYVHAAVGAESGLAEIHIPREIRGVEKPRENRMGSLLVNSLATESEVVAVPCVTLDDAFGEEVDGRVTVVWMDVEGAIGEVLAGARTFMDRAAVLYAEVYARSPWQGQMTERDVFDELARHGLAPLLRDCERPNQYNATFVREGLVTERYMRETADSVAARLDAILAAPADEG